jgi:hypothetical protein
MSKAKAGILVLVAVLLIACTSYFFSKETNSQFYAAKGLTVGEVVSRFGPPMSTQDGESSNNQRMYYLTDGLGTAELIVDQGRISDVVLYVED